MTKTTDVIAEVLPQTDVPPTGALAAKSVHDRFAGGADPDPQPRKSTRTAEATAATSAPQVPPAVLSSTTYTRRARRIQQGAQGFGKPFSSESGEQVQVDDPGPHLPREVDAAANGVGSGG